MEKKKTFKELFAGTGIEPTTDENGGVHYNFNATLKNKPMKLYTEEQVRFIVNESRYYVSWVDQEFELTQEEVISRVTPIELPSEHKIEESSFKMSGNNVSPSSNFMIGAYWMKEQILNQNKQNTNTNFTPHNANAVAEYNEGLNNFTPHNANAVAEYNEGLNNFTSNK